MHRKNGFRLAVAGVAALGCIAPALAQEEAVDEAQEEVREHPLISVSTAATTGLLIGEEVAEEDEDFARAQDFARARYAAIRREAATGSGEHLRALATLLHAPDRAAFGRWMQAHYAALFGSRAGRDGLARRIVALRG